jgi:hypothetical protein
MSLATGSHVGRFVGAEPQSIVADPTCAGAKTSARIPPNHRQSAGSGGVWPIMVSDLTMSLTTQKNPGPRRFPCWWQVQDSNLRRHKPTDLQSSAPRVVTYGFVDHPPTSPRIPHEQRHTVSDSWTRHAVHRMTRLVPRARCSTCLIAGFTAPTVRHSAHHLPHHRVDALANPVNRVGEPPSAHLLATDLVSLCHPKDVTPGSSASSSWVRVLDRGQRPGP